LKSDSGTFLAAIATSMQDSLASIRQRADA